MKENPQKGMNSSQIREILVAWAVIILIAFASALLIAKLFPTRETALPRVSQPATEVYPQ